MRRAPAPLYLARGSFRPARAAVRIAWISGPSRWRALFFSPATWVGQALAARTTVSLVHLYSCPLLHDVDLLRCDCRVYLRNFCSRLSPKVLQMCNGLGLGGLVWPDALRLWSPAHDTISGRLRVADARHCDNRLRGLRQDCSRQQTARGVREARAQGGRHLPSPG